MWRHICVSVLVSNIHAVRPGYATSHGLSFLWHLLSHVVANPSTTPRLRDATIDYVLTLHSLLGNDLLAAANGNSTVTRPMFVLLSDMLQVTWCGPTNHVTSRLSSANSCVSNSLTRCLNKETHVFSVTLYAVAVPVLLLLENSPG